MAEALIPPGIYEMTNSESTSSLAHVRRRKSVENCFIVQIHPLDLNRGPIEISSAPTTIGRNSQCHVRISNESVSRRHAEIAMAEFGAVIVDLGSTNGVVVNGEKVDEYRLSSGDCIELGNHVFRYLDGSDFESQYHATIYSMMTRDTLTRAYNRRYLEETLEREVARCKRHARPISVIMIDVDEFKTINDSRGHMIGDQVLRAVCERLQAAIRPDDVLARFGGEEFAIVLVESDLEHAAETAERCRASIAAEPIDTTAGMVSMTISLGVASPLPEDLGNSMELMTEADERMYEAKRAGRNRVVC